MNHFGKECRLLRKLEDATRHAIIGREKALYSTTTRPNARGVMSNDEIIETTWFKKLTRKER
jgi:hypothetical protein